MTKNFSKLYEEYYERLGKETMKEKVNTNAGRLRRQQNY